MRKEAALLLVFATLALPVGRAQAGTYEVTACGPDLVNRAWTFERYSMLGRELSDPSAFVTSADLARCGSEDGVSVVSRDETGVKRLVRTGEGAAFVFRAPAGTSVRSIQLWRNAVVRESTDDPATAPVESGVWTYVARTGDAFPPTGTIAAETCPGNQHGSDGVYCRRGNAPRSTVVPVSYAVGASTVAVGIECQGDPSSWCFTNTGAQGQGNAGLNFQRAIVTVDDPVAPTVSIAEEAWRRPGDAIAVTATDSAGVGRVRATMDGTDRVVESPACDYRQAAPCPTSASPGVPLTGLADGRHSLAVIAVDVGGNIALASRAVDVDGTAPTVRSVALNGRVVSAVVADALSGIAGGELSVRAGKDGAYTALPTTVRGGRLVATVPSTISRSRLGIRVSVSDRAGNVTAGAATALSLSGIRGGRATVRYGRSLRVSGRLTLTDGTILGSQSIAVTATSRVTGARPRTLSPMRTDASGRFSFVMPAGPSRDLNIGFAGADGFLASSRTLSVRVPASSSIRASSRTLSGAGTIRFSGRLRTRGASIPAGGKIVELQARQGNRWSTVATTRARPSWRAVARFRGTPGRYAIRLRIRREAAFGYELGYSPAVSVRVR
ncbi:hypothetical protein [Solirubrobacter soli]|uniref:hypothetical protein n=1 Tax=Solirubrobacter soli TaxID=363832 RepID=UPI0004168577|nr:hypothetical protein [Solirubrobacter soli]